MSKAFLKIRSILFLKKASFLERKFLNVSGVSFRFNILKNQMKNTGRVKKGYFRIWTGMVFSLQLHMREMKWSMHVMLCIVFEVYHVIGSYIQIQMIINLAFVHRYNIYLTDIKKKWYVCLVFTNSQWKLYLLVLQYSIGIYQLSLPYWYKIVTRSLLMLMETFTKFGNYAYTYARLVFYCYMKMAHV